MIQILLQTLEVHFSGNPIRSLAALLTLFPAIYLLVNEYLRWRARLAKFNGPPGFPLIGNLLAVKYNAAEQYRRWAKTYGDVYQIQLGNIPVLVVNSAAAVKTIFGGNSHALSSRPVFYTFHKIVSNTAGTTIGTSPYNDSLKRRRKGAASALNKPSIQTYIPKLDLETKDFLRDLLNFGDAGRNALNPMHSVERLSLSLALTLNWGTRIHQDDPMFLEITETESIISKYRSTTGNLQDYIPILRYNPFSGESTKAIQVRQRRDAYLHRLNKDLEERVENGSQEPCIQYNVMKDKEARLNKEELVSISLTMLAGGLDTVTALMQWSIAYLATRPDIQQQAYIAIQEYRNADDDMLGDQYDDQHCEYIVALVREFLRYFTPVRLSLPRATTKDFTYEGKVVPVGTTVFLNAWAANRDPNAWPDCDPSMFDPGRWLKHPNGPLFTYGLGYRMCTGSLLANRELYLVFFRMISAFEILPHPDPSKSIDLDPVSGNADPASLVSLPRNYEVIFQPRDEELLRVSLAERATSKRK